jgi:hypothetical protein
MTRNLQLRGLGACTQEAYLRAVQQLAAFYRPTPNQFNEEQLREYFLRLKNRSTYSKSSAAGERQDHEGKWGQQQVAWAGEFGAMPT